MKPYKVKQTEKQKIYKKRNELIEELKKNWPLTYQNEFRAQLKIIDWVLKTID